MPTSCTLFHEYIAFTTAEKKNVENTNTNILIDTYYLFEIGNKYFAINNFKFKIEYRREITYSVLLTNSKLVG